MTILEVDDLVVSYPVRKRLFGADELLHAVDQVSFVVEKGQTFGLVGESGSGKTSIGKAILGLEKFQAGRIVVNGETLTAQNQIRSQDYRRNVQMIFQNSYSSFNPKKNILAILTEPLKNLTHLSLKEQRHQALELLDIMKLPEQALEKYPDEFSGGQLQRIGVARAVIVKPKLVIADEPVSALDLSVQAEVLNYMQAIQEAFKMSYLFISHDLSVVQHMCQQMAIMHQGRFVELGDREAIYQKPQHLYTQQLIAAIPGELSLEETVQRQQIFSKYQAERGKMYDPLGRVHNLKAFQPNHWVSQA